MFPNLSSPTFCHLAESEDDNVIHCKTISNCSRTSPSIQVFGSTCHIIKQVLLEQIDMK